MNSAVKDTSILQGSVAIAETVLAASPGVIAVYPITPQTHIVEHLSKLIAQRNLNNKYLTVDSEFSAASVVLGAAATGVRSYTASASQGLLLMTEVIFNMAGTRLPGVFTAVNRSLSPPINIQVDHQDTMTLRDSGIIQLYVENIQEAIDTHIQIFKIAEHQQVLLPAMVCMDGWILSHAYEPVTLWKEEAVQEFLPEFDPVYRLDPQKPLTYGALTDDDKIMEFKFMVHEALVGSKEIVKSVALEFKEKFGNYHGDLVEENMIEDADIILVAMGSIAGTIKAALPELRKSGKKVGLLKIRAYRPFPDQEIRQALSKARVAIVLDRSLSCSVGGPLAGDIKYCLHNQDGTRVVNYIISLGGREVYPETIYKIVDETEKKLADDAIDDKPVFWDLNKDLL